MNFEKETEIDARLAAMTEDELRLVAKTAIALAATVLHSRQKLNAFLHDLAARFNQAGQTFGTEHTAQVADKLTALEVILFPPKKSTTQ